MIRWVVIIAVIALGIWGAKRTWRNFHQASSGLPAQSGSAVGGAGKGLGYYDIQTCVFEGRVGNTVYTSAGSFTRGRMSVFGYVQGFDGENVIRCRSPVGRTVFVVVEEKLRAGETGEKRKAEVGIGHGENVDHSGSGGGAVPSGASSGGKVFESQVSATPQTSFVLAPDSSRTSSTPTPSETPFLVTPPSFPAYHNNVPVAPRPVPTP